MLYRLIRALFPRFDYGTTDRDAFELAAGRWLHVERRGRDVFVAAGSCVLVLSLS